MKNRLNTRGASRNLFNLVLVASLALPLPALAASVTLASSPLQNAAASTVMPNVMFMLDDSGSMDWDYMPDDSKNFSGKYGFNTNHCNGVYYNPAITYTAPVKSDGSSYTDSTFTSAWTTGYNTGAGTVNLNTGFTGGSGSGSSGINLTPGPAFYYTYLTATTTPVGPGTQTANWQMDFHNTNSTFYKECISAVGSTTKVDGTNPVNTVFKITTLGSTETSLLTVNSSTANANFTITVSGANSTPVSSVKVGGTTITSGSSTGSATNSTEASNLASKITSNGYSATVSGAVITVTGPASVGSSVVVTNSSGSDTFTVSGISPISTISSIKVNGTELILSGSAALDSNTSTTATHIAAAINATGYTATASGSVVTITGPSSAANYTPVITYSGTMTNTVTQFPDTNAAHLQNFANWYSYYSNRMLMMKTGVGQAFSPIDSKYRVGFMTMNNNVSPDIVEIAPFDAAQRTAWYTKLYASTPGNSTPLREALSHVGQMYAHKFGNYDIYTATVTVGGSGSTVVNHVTVMESGAVTPVETMAGTTAGSTSTTTVAANIAGQINLLDPSNYGASSSSNIITITGPVTALGAVPVILNNGGGMTFTATSFVKTTINAQLNSITPADPVQYSCQQNFVILSTDGYWNGATDYDLSTPNKPVGNQDGIAPRPMYDGGLFTKTTSHTSQTQTQLNMATSQIQKRTTQITQRTQQIQQRTVQNQQRIQQIQKRTVQNQQRTQQITQRTQQITKRTQQITKRTVQNQQRTIQYQKCKAGPTSCQNIATCAGVDSTRPVCVTASDSGWVNAGTCTPSASGTGPQVTCQVASDSGFVNASSCAASNPASGPTVTCNTTDTGFVNASSCTASGPTAGQTITCNTTDTGFVNASSCTASGPTAGQTVTCNTTDTGFVNIGTCTASGPTGGQTVSCQVASDTGFVSASSCAASNPASGPTVTCNTADTGFVNIGTCTASGPTGGQTVSCQVASDTGFVNASSCAASNPASGPTVTCNTTDTGFVNASSCAASGPTAGKTITCNTTDTGFVGAASCANSGPTNGQTVYCPNPNPVVTGPIPVLSCTAGTSACTSPFTAASCIATSCTTKTIQSSTLVPSCTQGNSGTPNFIQTTCTTSTLSTTTNVTSCTPGNSGAPNFIQTTCTGGAGGTSDTLADVAMYYYQTDIRDASLDNCNGAVSTDFPSGNPDVCTNDVPESVLTQHMTTYTLGLGARGRMVYTSKDYMKETSGDFYSVYDPKQLGIKADSTQTPPICSWQADGTICNWPIPASGSINNIDDLWHAAVNGRGTYYSARDPAELSDGLSSALTSITAKKGAAAAAATSTLNPVAGNNFAYVASYTTLKWIGNLEARTIATDTGVISKNASWCAENIAADTCAAPGTVVTSITGNSTAYNCVTPNATAATCLFPNTFDSVANTCSAQMTLACTGTLPTMIGPVASPNTDPCYNNANCDKRTIKTADSSGNLVDFYYSNLTATQQAYFSATNISGLSQWTTLTAAQQTAAAGANLVNYLRGQKGYENNSTNPASNRFYRSREAVLGDALESQPSFIAAPTFSYADAGYSAFVAAKASRPGTVYMGANDGMLHAFDAQNGNERWAYVPSTVISNMWHLADTDYSIHHVNFVNGSPIISDYYCTTSCPGGAPEWRTILVGGLNAGGREYYALDITDPTAPTLMWEFTPTQDANLGYSFGFPVITKMADGTWVVLVTSGYDNGTLSGDGITLNSPTGDGKGYLYVLNARTGAIIKKIGDSTGTTTTPSGLAKFSTWNNATDSNLAGSTYGGDLLGNVWRFDINNFASPGTNPLQFAILKDASSVTQPVTASPILGEVKGHRVVFVGTGKYLENSDNSSTQTQTLYAIKDDSATAALVNPRSYTATAPKMVQQTISTNMVDPVTGTTIRQGSYNPVNFDSDRGWFVDFPESGERVNIDGKLVLGTLLVPTIVPKSTFCSPGGHGWLNYFDYTNGWPTTNGTGVGTEGTNQNVSVHFDASIVGMNILFIGGKPVVEVVTSDNPTPEIPSVTPVFNPGNSNFTGKRMQWRELIP